MIFFAQHGFRRANTDNHFLTIVLYLRVKVKPGTVVDRDVTEEGMWDFFLQSHAVIQGTGRPAHCVVLLNEIFRDRAKKLKSAKPQDHPANELDCSTP